MSNFQFLTPSYSHPSLPSYSQIINAHSRGEVSPFGLPHNKFQSAQPFKNNSSGAPLTFNTHSPHKPKLKKGFRPSSKGGGEGAGKEQQKSNEKSNSRNKLEDFAKTSSTIIKNGNNLTIEKSPFKADNFRSPLQDENKRQHEKEFIYTSPYDDNNSRKKEKSISKEEFRNAFSKEVQLSERVPSFQGHSTTLLQHIEEQKKTIDNFQEEIVRLNTELTFIKNQTQQKDFTFNAKNESTFEGRVSYLIEQNKGLAQKIIQLSAKICQLQKQSDNRSQHNNYLQSQCKQYLQRYQQSAFELQASQQKNLQLEKQIQKLRMQALIQQTRLKEREFSDERNMRFKEEELKRLRSLVDAQKMKLQQQEHTIQQKKQEMSIVLMKLQYMQNRSEQLALNNYQSDKKIKYLQEELSHQKDSTDRQKKAQQIQWMSKLRQKQESNQKLCAIMVALEDEIKKIRQQSIKQSYEYQETLAFERAKLEQVRTQMQAVEREHFQLRINYSELQELLRTNSEKMGKKEVQIQNLKGKASRKQIVEGQLERQKTLVCKIESQKNILILNNRKLEEEIKKREDELTAQKGKWQGREKQLMEELEQKGRQIANQYKAIELHLTNRHQIQKAELEKLHLCQINELKEQLKQKENGYSAELIESRRSLEIYRQKCAQALKLREITQKRYQIQLSILKQQAIELKLNLKQNQNICQKVNVSTNTNTASDLGEISQEQGQKKQYLEVDREGLIFLCQLVDCQMTEGKILNTIIESAMKKLTDTEIREKCWYNYEELLDLFEIQHDQNCQSLLLDQINNLKQTASFFLNRTRELEQKCQELESKKQERNSKKNNSKSRQGKMIAKERDLKLRINSLQVLNENLNRQIMQLEAKVQNCRMGTRTALRCIETFGTSEQQSKFNSGVRET